MNRAFKYRIYPNQEQCVLIAKTFYCTQMVYNHFLDEKIRTYQENGTNLSYFDCSAKLPVLKREFAFLTEVDSIALQQSLRFLDTEFSNFFKHKRIGYPRFKSKWMNGKAYTTVCTNNNVRIDNGKLVLPKLGKVSIKLHRDLPDGFIIKSATISQNPSGQYFVILQCEAPDIHLSSVPSN